MSTRIIEIDKIKEREIDFGSINWTAFINADGQIGLFYKGQLMKSLDNIQAGDKIFIQTDYPTCTLEKVKLPKDPRKALLWEYGFRNYMYKDTTEEMWKICWEGPALISDGYALKKYKDATVSSCWTNLKDGQPIINGDPVAIYISSSATLEDIKQHIKLLKSKKNYSAICNVRRNYI